MLKYGVKLDVKQLYIKTRFFKKEYLNKERWQFRIFFLVYNADCSLRFHRLGIDKVCEVDPVFQGIFSTFRSVGNFHVCS